MTRVLLDTQVFLMAASEGWPLLPKQVRQLLSNIETDIVLSVISIAEIAIKTSIGKLNMSADRVSQAVADLRATVLPFTVRHAMRMVELPLLHKEPFDRMLIAVALAEGIALVGGDEKFPAYRSQGLAVIWNR